MQHQQRDVSASECVQQLCYHTIPVCYSPSTQHTDYLLSESVHTSSVKTSTPGKNLAQSYMVKQFMCIEIQ